MPHTLIIRHLSDLDRMLHAGGPRITKLRIEIANMPRKERKQLQHRLFAQYNACGCTETSICIMLGLILAGLFYSVSSDIGLVGYRLWLLCFTFVILSGLSGKLLGKWRANKHLQNTILQAKETLK